MSLQFEGLLLGFKFEIKLLRMSHRYLSLHPKAVEHIEIKLTSK